MTRTTTPPEQRPGKFEIFKALEKYKLKLGKLFLTSSKSATTASISTKATAATTSISADTATTTDTTAADTTTATPTTT